MSEPNIYQTPPPFQQAWAQRSPADDHPMRDVLATQLVNKGIQMAEQALFNQQRNHDWNAMVQCFVAQGASVPQAQAGATKYLEERDARQQMMWRAQRTRRRMGMWAALLIVLGCLLLWAFLGQPATSTGVACLLAFVIGLVCLGGMPGARAAAVAATARFNEPFTVDVIGDGITSPITEVTIRS